MKFFPIAITSLLFALTGCAGQDADLASASSVSVSQQASSSLVASSPAVASSSQDSSSQESTSQANSAQQNSSIATGPNQLPSVTITTPLEGQTLKFGQPLLIEAQASDADGAIQDVALFFNGLLVVQDRTAPYRWEGGTLPHISRPAIGPHTLEVVATDNLGATRAQTLNIRVDVESVMPPTASFMTPAAGLNLPALSSIDVLASAAAESGVASVSLFVNDQLIAEDTRAPYEWEASDFTSLAGLASGNYTLRLQVVDGGGVVGEATRSLVISSSAPTDSGDPALGAKQYAAKCMNCHGQFGEGAAQGKALLLASEVGYNIANPQLLAQTIDSQMPPAEPTLCEGQCARNVASYLRDVLPALAAERDALQPNVMTGQLEYAAQCASCHGDDAKGAEEGGPILPLRDDESYNLRTIDYAAQVGLSAKLDLGMPLGRFSFSDATAKNCSGQCAVDVEAYLTQLDDALTPEELLALQLTRGEKDYAIYCGRCHGDEGFTAIFGVTPIIPLDPIFASPTTLDENDNLFVYNRDTMPPRTTDKCVGRCAADVSVYIREVLAR